MASKFGVKEVADVTFYSLVNNKPVLYLDTLKMTNLENTSSTSDARGGKGNPKLLTWDFDREATMQVQDALMTEKSIALLTGNDLIEGSAKIHQREIQTAETSATAGQTKITLNNTVADTSNDFYYKADGTEVTPVSVSGNVVEFSDLDVAVGDEVTAYYKYDSATTAKTIKVTSDAFPAYYKIIGDTVVRNAETGVDEPFQIVLHKAKLQAGFTMTFQAEGDPTVFDMNLEVFRTDTGSNMIEMIKY